ncbi:MAG: 3-dehydroquinate synthase, partial [Nitrospinae bacterium]|nr:3-dehydroquinate synthase [Nitrospinota bacterium]
MKNCTKKEIINVELKENSYEINLGSQNINELGEIISHVTEGRNVGVITNPAIGEIYFAKVKASLEKSGLCCSRIDIPEGEEHKNFNSLKKIYSELLKNNFDRKSILVALGGGIVGDITGFAAASFMRGVPFVQVPTSLLAMVDSSVGGKTGINLPEGKNLVGAIYQPKHVLIDVDMLISLSPAEFNAGMAEVIKYAFISKHGDLINILRNRVDDIKRLNPTCLKEIIKSSCEIKAQIVSEDECETKDIRSFLNFGHTFGHAVESITNYKEFRHGEAVSIGMVYAGILSKLMETGFQEE